MLLLFGGHTQAMLVTGGRELGYGIQGPVGHRWHFSAITHLCFVALLSFWATPRDARVTTGSARRISPGSAQGPYRVPGI